MEVKIESFDDGHRPGKTELPSQIAINMNKGTSNFVSIFNDCLKEPWCNRIYEFALKRNRPWGVYIITDDAINCKNELLEELWNSDKDCDKEKAIGLISKKSLILQKGKDIIEKDLENIHGTVVWCLSSGLSNSVQYHIDYAELYRYETNVIHPPLYAGTMHVSPLEDGEMIGGDFKVNMGGLNHYSKFGYKGKLKTKEDLINDMNTNSDWITMKYKNNRGMIHDGDFPHLSTPVTVLNNNKKRVILGFNCFTSTVGECCVRAPEHSDAFNRTIKIYQVMSSLGQSITPGASGIISSNEYDNDNNLSQSSKLTSIGDNNINKLIKKSGGGISAKEILKNPVLAKMLVLAAKKVKDQNKIKEQEELESEKLNKI